MSISEYLKLLLPLGYRYPLKLDCPPYLLAFTAQSAPPGSAAYEWLRGQDTYKDPNTNTVIYFAPYKPIYEFPPYMRIQRSITLTGLGSGLIQTLPHTRASSINGIPILRPLTQDTLDYYTLELRKLLQQSQPRMSMFNALTRIYYDMRISGFQLEAPVLVSHESSLYHILQNFLNYI